MEVGDAEAQAGGGREAAGGGVHQDGGGGEGVGGGEEEGAPVLTGGVGGRGGAGEDIVPSGEAGLERILFWIDGMGGGAGCLLEDVAFGRVGNDVGWRVLLDVLVFSGQLREVLVFGRVESRTQDYPPVYGLRRSP